MEVFSDIAAEVRRVIRVHRCRHWVGFLGEPQALATQGHAGLYLDGRSYPLSLYLITVVASGDRKTAADRFALLPARQWEREQWQRYREQLARYRVAQRQAQRINPAEPDSASGATLEAEPSAPRLITTDPTIEALLGHLAACD